VGELAERDPEDVLDELLFGFFGTQLLYVVAELGIADLIDGEEASVDELAVRAGAVPDVLYRYLRAFASLGVFEEVEERVFAQTPASLLLRQDAGTGWQEFAVIYGSVYRAFAEALPAAREGKNMFELASGSGWWDWLAARPEASAAFNRAMQAGAQARLATLANFPWHEVATVVDVGGGNGTLIVGLLAQHPHLRGVIFDLPEVASAATAQVAKAGLGDRCSVEEGSFFERVPDGADVYVLAKVLHDWDDEAALKILRRVGLAAAVESRLLVLDSVLAADGGSQRTILLDLVMLALVNGRERTTGEWTELLKRGGWLATSVQNGLIEAQPASGLDIRAG
jgi:O-methyltransferase domain